ncbi:MAG: TetR/AcrR family transcriptional regulator [Candidatus Nanopelagicales bacterium]
MSTAAATEKAAPLTDRGRRTREKLLAAAREVFEQRGYASTRMADIARAAGVSHGTTYTWFADKEAVLRALVDTMIDEVYAALAIGEEIADPQERMLEANRRYLAAYRRHGRMLEVVEEAAMADSRYRDALSGVRRDHVARVSRDIARLQKTGVADGDVDPHVAAAALCAMVEGFGRHWYGRGEGEGSDDDLAVTTLTTLWARGLGVRTRSSRSTTSTRRTR